MQYYYKVEGDFESDTPEELELIEWKLKRLGLRTSPGLTESPFSAGSIHVEGEIWDSYPLIKKIENIMDEIREQTTRSHGRIYGYDISEPTFSFEI